MNDLMEAIYNGKLYPSEQIVPEDPAYQEANSESDMLLHKLEGMLNEEEMGLVMRLLELEDDVHDIMCLETFKYGFSLGLRLRQEAAENPYLPGNNKGGE